MSEPDPRPEPGLPRIPRTPMSWLTLAYAAFGGVALSLYLAAGIFGWSLDADERDVVPLSVRQTPGGYRSYHLWHAGYQGGK